MQGSSTRRRWSAPWDTIAQRARARRSSACQRRYRPRVALLDQRLLLSHVYVVTSPQDDGSIGTLRYEIEQVNLDSTDNPSSPDQIVFAITGGGPDTIWDINLGSNLPTIQNPVVIDGTSQPGYGGSPLIDIFSGLTGYGGSPLIDIFSGLNTATRGLTIAAGSSTVRGLAIVNATDTGIIVQGAGGNTIEGDYIGMNGMGAAEGNLVGITIDGSSSNTIGGTTADARNVIGGNTMYGVEITNSGGAANANTIEGNYIGTRPDGLGLTTIGFPDANAVQDIVIDGSDSNTIGGTASGAGNLIAGSELGIDVDGHFNVIAGNEIGTDAHGTAALSLGSGIRLELGATQNTIGGSTGGGNLISGNSAYGLEILGDANTVAGNQIGTDVTGGAPLGNGLAGISIAGSNNMIGGTAFGAGNTIAFNAADGVVVASGSGDAILGNSIYANSRLGIELGDNGVIHEHPGGLIAGMPNGDQNFPILTSASTDETGVTTIQGVLNGAPNTSYGVEFFDNSTADPSGYGQGNFFFAVTTVTTDGTGKGSINYSTLSVQGVPGGGNISATATDPGGNTSEFSAEIQVTGPQFFDVFSCSADPSVYGSLPWAIEQVNSDTSDTAAHPDVIDFGIPESAPGFNAGAGVWTIQPQSDLPTISNPVTIDGYSQTGASRNTLAIGDNAVLSIQIDGSQDSGSGFGLTLAGGSSTVDGLVINGFSHDAILLQSGGQDIVAGNFLGTDPTGSQDLGNGGDGVSVVDPSGDTIGGTAAASRNVIAANHGDGISIDEFDTNGGGISSTQQPPSNNLVENNYIGTDASGTKPLGNHVAGVHIARSPRNQIIGNVISANGEGMELSFNDSSGAANDNVVQGNLIGINAAGTSSLANRSDGIFIQAGATGNIIGGSAAGTGNVISGNGGNGVRLASAPGNTIEGNLIGVAQDGAAPIPNATGVSIDGSSVADSSNTIGGVGAGQGNTIVGNTGDGVVADMNGVAVLSNSIAVNGGLGIEDLNGVGVTYQAAPILTSAAVSGDNLVIRGTVSGTPGAALTVQVFAGPSLDAKGSPEGKTLLGTVSAVVSGSGTATISATVAAGALLGQFVTATATDVPNGTSEFSNNAQVVRANQAPAFTTANSTTFTVGQPDSFTVIATGTPPPTVSESGELPSGVTFDPLTDMLSGTPAAGTAGTYHISFTADNSAGAFNQPFTLIVNPSAAPGTPNAPVLSPQSDTGVSASDGITSDNGSTSAPLTFTVTGISPADGFVQLYEVTALTESIPLGPAVQAVDGTATVTLSGSPLSDGSYQIAATAAATAAGIQSPPSATTVVTVQTSCQITAISPSTNFLTSLPNNKVVITFNHWLAGLTPDVADGTGFDSNPFAVMLVPSGPDGAQQHTLTNTYWSAPSGVDGGDLPLPDIMVYHQNPNGTSTISLTPTQPLSTDLYLIQVGKLTDLAGNSLAGSDGVAGHPYFASFDYRPTPVTFAPPRVTSVTAYEGALSIDNNQIDQPDTIGIHFNKSLDPWTVNTSTIGLYYAAGHGNYAEVPAAVAYSPTTDTAYLTPEATLAPGTLYIVSVSGAVSDDQGFPNPGAPLSQPYYTQPGQPYYTTFTVLGPSVGKGWSPLGVWSTTPQGGDAWTGPLGYVSVSFSEAIDPTSMGRYSAMLITHTGGVSPGNSGYADVPLNAKVAFNPNTDQLIIVPTGELPNNVIDLVALSNITAANGDPLANAPVYATFLLSTPPSAAVTTPSATNAVALTNIPTTSQSAAPAIAVAGESTVVRRGAARPTESVRIAPPRTRPVQTVVSGIARSALRLPQGPLVLVRARKSR